MHIAMSEFFVCTFIAFISLPCDGPVSPEDSFSLHCIWDTGVVMSIPSSVFEVLKNMGVMVVLHDPSFDTALSYMASCRSFDVN